MSHGERIRVVVLFGGRSAEHDVSCTSAVSILRSLDRERYDIVPVGVTRDGAWVRSDTAEALVSASADALGLPMRVQAEGTETHSTAVLAAGRPDEASTVVVLPVLHGPFGEDGTIQGLLEVAGVPYVGSGVLGSAVGMDKSIAKSVLDAAGIPQAKWFSRAAWQLEGPQAMAALRADAESALAYPVFVKPANMGSSIGVSKAHDAAELDAAVAEALLYDDWIVFEESITGREIEFGVLGNERPEVSVAGEVKPGREFYDYEDKYLDDAAELMIPAVLDPAVQAEGQRLAAAAYTALRAEGMARVDFFYDERPGGRGWLVNEINTIPGFTPISQFPKLWAASGVPYPQLLDRLVELALARHARRSGRVGRSR